MLSWLLLSSLTPTPPSLPLPTPRPPTPPLFGALGLHFSAQALYHAHALSEGGQRHVTIADLSQGVIHPSKVFYLRRSLSLLGSLLSRGCRSPRGRGEAVPMTSNALHMFSQGNV